MSTLGSNTRGFYSVPAKIWIILACVTLFLGSLIGLFTNAYRDRLVQEIHHDAAYELAANAATLSAAITIKLQLTNGIKAFVLNELAHTSTVSRSRFDTFAAAFIERIPGIRNVSLYPDGIAEYVFPLAGNEEVLGLDLFRHPDPSVRENAERAKLADDMTILGPIELTQGGVGLISRQSVYVGDRFWGFVSVVLDNSSILQEADLFNGDKGIDLSVRANGRILIGDPRLFDHPGLLEKVALPDGQWEIAAVPNRSRLDSIASKIHVVQATCAGSLLLIVYFLYVQLTQKARLQLLVEERTRKLEITNRKLETAFHELSAAAYHDAVTGMRNRTFFNEHLADRIAECGRTGEKLALLYLDLDHFKMVNDSLGHIYGDLLLREVARRLSDTLRNGEVISRIGGDEFTIIVPSVKDQAQVKLIARQIRELFQQPFLLRDSEYLVTTSIGIALFPNHAQDDATLIRNADLAMYRAKEEGKNLFRFYDPAMNPNAEETMEIKLGLRRALEKNEFTVHYQPQIEARTGKLIGLEALIRWEHPVRGLIPPNHFIPIAEETGLILPIGEKVLSIVCAQSIAWQRAGIPPIRIAVNLSARQFAQEDLAERINGILERHGLDPKYIELEITENTAMKDDMQPALNELRERGFTIAIDDFGTQYSSLNYLKRLPVDKIKIDRSFVSGIARDRKDEAIIVAMLQIANRLNLTVIAEGVETNEQLAFLRDNNCQEIQGFIFSKPQPAERIEPLLTKALIS
ncbi:putative bifunctional diguanylate cyclase/phosphodiesterase [Cohnella terricola]|uniref:EAL domain-containing protein n=1 Tax=Cohnella terricola TaxID=1289167 RepID=A0A559JJ71_9BACL|nr:EAL domain-containing protein [Cohnella terricola]TVX99909.1 EAL domain-containing protein [Cohnella terricola]